MDETNESNCKYAYLHSFPISKLLSLLAVAPVPAVGPEDEAYVDALEEVIIEKELKQPTGILPDVKEQWEDFQVFYLSSHIEDLVIPELPGEKPERAVQKSKTFRFKRIWRTVFAAAAAIVCSFAVLIVVQAAGIDVLGAMARWTEDVFSFGQIPPNSAASDTLNCEDGVIPSASPGLEIHSSFQEALDEYGITEVHEPTWLPAGYILDSIEVTRWDDPSFICMDVSYRKGDEYLGITIMSYDGEPSMQVEKNNVPVEQIEKDGTTFFLIENMVDSTVAWLSDSYEYYVSGSIDKESLWNIAQSML